MIRVLHYIGLLEFGGSQSFVMEIYKKINKSKIQFDFITFPDQKDGFYNEIIDMGGKVYECPQYNGKNHFEFKRWWKKLFICHPEYKIVHIHVRSVASLCIPIAHKNGCYVIVHSHSISNGRGLQAMVKNTLQLPIRYKADYMLACSKKAGEWLFGKNITKKNNYKVINNAIDANRFNYDINKRNIIRKELGIEDKLVLGHVGRMTEAKNHKFLIEVFAEVIKKRTDTVLLLVGDGKLIEDIVKQCNDFNVSDNVVFLGSKSNTEDYYQAMDVFVFPSLWEGLGISVIEAQACGLQCVISNKIPIEVNCVSSLINTLSVDDGAEKWASQIIKCNISNRNSKLEEIINAGYDVSANAIEIEKLYNDIYHKISNVK